MAWDWDKLQQQKQRGSGGGAGGPPDMGEVLEKIYIPDEDNITEAVEKVLEYT
jgi:hypothetical protein